MHGRGGARSDGTRRIAAGLLLSAITAGVSWGDSVAGPDRFLPVLPDGKGVEKVMQHCGLCHGIELVAQQRLDGAEWTKVVDQMIEFGAGMKPEDRREILDYLTTYLGPNSRQ